MPEAGYYALNMVDTDTTKISGLYNKAPAGALLSVVENLVKELPALVHLH